MGEVKNLDKKISSFRQLVDTEKSENSLKI
jgi:hypothetical protein